MQILGTATQELAAGRIAEPIISRREEHGTAGKLQWRLPWQSMACRRKEVTPHGWTGDPVRHPAVPPS